MSQIADELDEIVFRYSVVEVADDVVVAGADAVVVLTAGCCEASVAE